MDGTLVDNTAAHIRAFEIFCDRYGVTDWKERLSRGYGMGNDDIMRLIMPEAIIRVKGTAALAEEKEAIYRELYARRSGPSRDSANCSRHCTTGASVAPSGRRDAGKTSISYWKSATSGRGSRPGSRAMRSRAANPTRRSTSKPPRPQGRTRPTAWSSRMPRPASNRHAGPASDVSWRWRPPFRARCWNAKPTPTG